MRDGISFVRFQIELFSILLGLYKFLFGKQKLYLGMQRPVRADHMRFLGVRIRLHRGIQRKLADFEDLAETAAHRKSQHVTLPLRIPVSCDDWCADSIPATAL